MEERSFPSEVIIMNDFPKHKKSHKKSVRSYASGVFQESTIGMVSSIVTTHSRARKCFKSLLFALCISGFLYQAITYLEHVFEYPTNVDIDIQRPDKFNLPAYTFCNKNGLKRSVFCNLYPERCYEPSQKFCSRFYSYCGSNKTVKLLDIRLNLNQNLKNQIENDPNLLTKVPMKKYYKLEDSMTFEDILKYGNNLDDFLVSNKSVFYEDLMKGPYIRTKEDESGAMICYSYNSVVGSKEYPKQKKKESFNFVNTPANKFTFYIEENEMFIPGNRPGLLFSIHSPYEAVNPFIKGIFMKPGRTYKIYVSMQEEVLLKEPFQTNCVDYEEIWEANNHTGPRIQLMCEHKCLLEYSLACYSCAAPSVLYPNDERICLADDYDNVTCDDLMSSIDEVYTCLKTCKDDCRVTKYSPEVMERYEVDFSDDEDHEEFSRFITVEIYLEDGEIMTLRYSPKYMTVEVFSAIGGFIGVWLGISFMDIIDVFASVFLVSKYAFRKHKARRAHSLTK